MAILEVLLGPVKLLAVVVNRLSETARATGPHQGQLDRTTILLGKVCDLELRVASCGCDLVKLELVDAACSDCEGQKGDDEWAEDFHDGGLGGNQLTSDNCG